jgi:antirestriction protein ArdC
MTLAAKTDLYARITNRIVAELEAGTRPWLKPWNAEHASGRVTRPLRHNGTPTGASTSLCSGRERALADSRARSG